MIIDFHSHCLPHLDDGADSTATSLAMLEESARQGTEICIATPHFYATHMQIEDFLERREAAWQKLQAAYREKRGRIPHMLLGAEVAYFAGISQSQKIGSLCVASTRLLLLELPFGEWDETVLRDVEELCKRYSVILAHLDRYLPITPNLYWVQELQQLPLTVQINAEALTDFWNKRRVKKRITTPYVLGSDMHNLTSRPPNLKKGRQALSEERLAAIDIMGMELLQNERI